MGGFHSDKQVNHFDVLTKLDYNRIDARIDWNEFKDWLKAKYVIHYADVLFCYAKKYCSMLNDVKKIELIPQSNRNNVIKSLIVSCKFLGVHEQFKTTLKNHGIKSHKQNSIESFLCILRASDSDICQWYDKASDAVRDNEKLYLTLMKVSGLRTTEGLLAFNKIIELSKQGKLNEYYDTEFSKNCYISFIPQSLVNQIANSTFLTYPQIRKRLNRHKLKIRISELRDYFGSYLLQHSILEAEVNLCQGRIPVDIFIRHYWSPRLTELRDRIFRAIL